MTIQELINTLVEDYEYELEKNKYDSKKKASKAIKKYIKKHIGKKLSKFEEMSFITIGMESFDKSMQDKIDISIRGFQNRLNGVISYNGRNLKSRNKILDIYKSYTTSAFTTRSRIYDYAVKNAKKRLKFFNDSYHK